MPNGRSLPLTAEPPSAPLPTNLYSPVVIEYVPEFDVADHIYSQCSIRNRLSRVFIYLRFQQVAGLNRGAMSEGGLVGVHNVRQINLRINSLISRIPVQLLDTGFAKCPSDECVSFTRISYTKLDMIDIKRSRRHGAVVVYHSRRICLAWIERLNNNGDPSAFFADKGINLSFDRPDRNDSNPNTENAHNEETDSSPIGYPVIVVSPCVRINCDVFGREFADRYSGFFIFGSFAIAIILEGFAVTVLLNDYQLLPLLIVPHSNLMYRLCPRWIQAAKSEQHGCDYCRSIRHLPHWPDLQPESQPLPHRERCGADAAAWLKIENVGST